MDPSGMLGSMTQKEIFEKFVDNEKVKTVTVGDLKSDVLPFDPEIDFTKMFAKIIAIKGGAKIEKHGNVARTRKKAGTKAAYEVKLDGYAFYFLAR